MRRNSADVRALCGVCVAVLPVPHCIITALLCCSSCNGRKINLGGAMSYPTNDNSKWEPPEVETLVLPPRRRSIIREEQPDGKVEEKDAPLERWNQVGTAADSSMNNR